MFRTNERIIKMKPNNKAKAHPGIINIYSFNGAETLGVQANQSQSQLADGCQLAFSVHPKLPSGQPASPCAPGKETLHSAQATFALLLRALSMTDTNT